MDKKHMADTSSFDLLPWAMGALTAIGVGAWGRQQMRMTKFEETVMAMREDVATMNANILNLSDRLDKHMEHEEKSDGLIEGRLRSVEGAAIRIEEGMKALEKRSH